MTNATAALLGELIGAFLGGFLWVGILSWLLGKIVNFDLVKEFVGAFLTFGLGVWNADPLPPSFGTYLMPLFGVAFWLPLRRYKARKAGRAWPVIIPASAPATIGYRLCFSAFVLSVLVGGILSLVLAGGSQGSAPLVGFLFFLCCGLSLFLLRRWAIWLLGQKNAASSEGR